MPAIATMTINDGQGTPVAHTFSPASQQGTRVTWADRSPTIPAGFRTISHEFKEPTGGRTVYSHNLAFVVPVVATVDGVDTVTGYESATVVLNCRPNSTLQNRKDLMAYVANCLANANVKAAVENVEPFY